MIYHQKDDKIFKMRELSDLPVNYDYKTIVKNNEHCFLTKFKSKEDVEVRKNVLFVTIFFSKSLT